MALETGTYISGLVVTNPDGASPKSSMDDHLRLIKSTIKTTFPNVTGAMTATHTELSYMVGATIQPAMKDGSNLTTPTAGDSTTKIATTAFVAGTAFASALPAQTGNAGKYVTTNGATASWASIIPPQILRSARTSNTILATADSQNLIDITSGTFTQTFDAAATLADGWFVYLRNSGTGDITLDPSGAELIDGLTSYIMYPGECRLVQCNGTAFTSVVLSPFSRIFTTTGTFVKPPGYAVFSGIAWSGGASGERTNSATVASHSGAGAGSAPFMFSAEAVGASVSVTIGAGGAAVTAVAVGNVGGNTSFGSLFTVYAGLTYSVGGSIKSGLTNVAGVSPTGFEGAVSEAVPLGSVYGGGSGSSSAGANGSVSVYGGAPGGSISSAAVVRAAGTSVFGGSGGAASSAGNGTDGATPGGGGGATQTGASSGAGARGELRIWGIA